MTTRNNHSIGSSRRTGFALLFTAATALGAFGPPPPVHADNPDTWVNIAFSSLDKNFAYDTGYFANTNDKAFNECEASERQYEHENRARCSFSLLEKNTCAALVVLSGPAYQGQYPSDFKFATGPTRDAARAAALQQLGHPGDVLADPCSTDGVPTPPPGAIIPHPGENQVGDGPLAPPQPGATAIIPPGVNSVQ